ncbi:MAG: sterol desaturase family protein [Deltaproteobacteria bacterium]|nr:sterol desaturase family protein [Deltaproteobacteria bacterium]
MANALPYLVFYAIPFFALLMALEAVWLRARGARAVAQYERKDWLSSIAMGIGNMLVGAAIAPVVHAAMSFVYAHRLSDITMSAQSYVALVLLEDLAYYGFHRASHEVRYFWAGHVNHHSSEHYNLGTAMRQSWTSWLSGGWVFWLPLCWLGFTPSWVTFQIGLSLLYQYWVHTEAVGRMPPWFEAVMSTPSSHRVHHARNAQYLDKNYGGIFIVWDRWFGTFVRESERPTYGIVTPIKSFNPLWIAVHEWVAIAIDVGCFKGARAKLTAIFGRPSEMDALRRSQKRRRV